MKEKLLLFFLFTGQFCWGQKDTAIIFKNFSYSDINISCKDSSAQTEADSLNIQFLINLDTLQKQDETSWTIVAFNNTKYTLQFTNVQNHGGNFIILGGTKEPIKPKTEFVITGGFDIRGYTGTFNKMPAIFFSNLTNGQLYRVTVNVKGYVK